MSDQEIKKLLNGIPADKKEVGRTGLELGYFNEQDIDYIKKDTTSLFEAEKLLTTRRLEQVAY